MICLKEYKSIIITLSVIALIAAGIVNYVKDLIGQPPESAPEHLQVKAPAEKILHSQKIKDEQGNDIVKYLYASEIEVPAKTIKIDEREIKEDISKRTKNAQFFKKGGLHSPEGLWSQDVEDTQEGSTAPPLARSGDYGASTANKKEVWVGRFYAGEPFYKDAAENKWYQTETATTTAEEFSKQTKPNFLAKLKAFFNINALADTGSYYAGTGDGRVGFINQAIWDTGHNSTVGSSVSYTTATAVVKSEDVGDSGWHSYGMFRMFIPIDTSGINDSGIISTAKLYLYCTAKSSSDNDGDDWVNVVQTSQANTNSLVTEDYDQCGAIHSAEEGCDTRIDISSASTATWWNWILNTTGKSWINKTGWTKLGVREGHDILDFPIAVDYAVNSVTFSMSEQTGTSQDPYLEVTYTVPAAPVKFRFDGGQMKIKGKVKFE